MLETAIEGVVEFVDAVVVVLVISIMVDVISPVESANSVELLKVTVELLVELVPATKEAVAKVVLLVATSLAETNGT